MSRPGPQQLRPDGGNPIAAAADAMHSKDVTTRADLSRRPSAQRSSVSSASLPGRSAAGPLPWSWIGPLVLDRSGTASADRRNPGYSAIRSAWKAIR